MKRRDCKLCGAGFEPRELAFAGRVLFSQSICDRCSAEREAAEQAEAARAREVKLIAKRNAAWLKLCPPLYADTDPARLPARFRDAAAHWQFGPRGLGLVGPTGTGKTRAAWLLLKRMFLIESRRCQAMTATVFARACAEQFADDTATRAAAATALAEARDADVLLLDDLGKARLTDRGESELYDTLEHRSAQRKPTIWTSNAGRAEMAAMLSEDRAEPILRRLAEFSEVVLL